MGGGGGLTGSGLGAGAGGGGGGGGGGGSDTGVVMGMVVVPVMGLVTGLPVGVAGLVVVGGVVVGGVVVAGVPGAAGAVGGGGGMMAPGMSGASEVVDTTSSLGGPVGAGGAGTSATVGAGGWGSGSALRFDIIHAAPPNTGINANSGHQRRSANDNADGSDTIVGVDFSAGWVVSRTVEGKPDAGMVVVAAFHAWCKAASLGINGASNCVLSNRLVLAYCVSDGDGAGMGGTSGAGVFDHSCAGLM